jgi:hypothetical protein
MNVIARPAAARLHDALKAGHADIERLLASVARAF